MRDSGAACDAIVVVANWPESRREHWKTLLRARAIENQCYVIGVNRVGVDGNGISYRGDSAIIDYCGTALFGECGDACVRCEELSLGKLREYRESFPAWKDADRFVLEP
jgi:predicted amidohydrolase